MEGIKNIIFDLGGVILNIDMRAEAVLTAQKIFNSIGHGFADAFSGT
jgi:hypothetical protein